MTITDDFKAPIDGYGSEVFTRNLQTMVDNLVRLSSEVTPTIKQARDDHPDDMRNVVIALPAYRLSLLMALASALTDKFLPPEMVTEAVSRLNAQNLDEAVTGPAKH